MATATGTLNNEPDNSPGDYQAEVNWGDGGGFSSQGIKLTAVGNAILIKGSHIYQTPNTYNVSVMVTGPGGSTDESQTTSVVVSNLPDAASLPPQVPTSYTGAQPLGNVGLTISGTSQIQSFAGVGFALNPVATVAGLYNNETDNTPGDYHSQINWGDSPTWDTNTKLASVGDSILIKGSHIYQQTGTFQVTVYVTGPDGQTASDTSSSVVVNQMPDAASRPPDVPTSEPAPQPVGSVGLVISGTSQIQSFAGVGFALNPVATVAGLYNNETDNTPGDYHAQINWGDSPTWDTNTKLASVGDSILIKGSHIYQQTGTYQVTVYVTGPDGQTVSDTSSSVVVSQMPDPASRPPAVPVSEPGPEPIGSVSLTISGASAIEASAGDAIDGAAIGSVSGIYNDQSDTTIGDYHVQINWGDSPQWVGGTVLAGSGSSIKLYGSHTYDSAGTYDVTVYVTGPDGQTASGFTTVVDVSQRANGLIVSPNPKGNAFSIETGQTIENYVASVRTTNPDATVTGLTAQITDGDGTQSSGHIVMVGPGQVWQVTSPYVYQKAGTYTLTINVTDDQGDSGSVQAKVTVTAPSSSPSPTPTPSPTPPPLQGGLNINPDTFITQYEKQFSTKKKPAKLSASAASGLRQLIGFINADPNITDVRWAAYMLATTKEETGSTFQPVTERGSRSYFNKYNPGTKAGKAVGNTQKGDGYLYRGRGYVQITGRGLYTRLGNDLDVDLVDNPSLALDPQIAYKIMSYGMRNGSFTGVGLSNYLNSSETDYYDARRIINGIDQAKTIAGYAAKFQAALTASQGSP